MKTNETLKAIEKKNFEMGNEAYEKFMKDGGITTLNGAVRAYRASMQALRYQIMFGNAFESNK